MWPHKTHHFTLFTQEGCGFSFTRSLLWDWSYHPNCWCSGEHGLLAVEVKVHCGLWLQSWVPGLLSFIEVYLGFFLYSKLEEVIIGRPLVCSLTVNQMGHPSSQLRIHASKEVINQQSPSLFRGTS